MVNNRMDLLSGLRKQHDESDPDLLRAIVAVFLYALMGAQVDAICNASYSKRSPKGENQRTGYPRWRWVTRVSTIDLAIPKLRRGSYFPKWLSELRRRAEQALVRVVADCYLARALDTIVEQFRSRPLQAAPYTHVWINALVLKCSQGRWIVNVCAMIATAFSADGHREILRIGVVSSEGGVAGPTFLRDLMTQRLPGVELVVSDSRQGLIKDTIATVLQGET